MPNRDTHVLAGALCAAIAALHLSRDERPEHRFAETLGGVLGGCLGSRLPDLFDPPIGPLHRSYAHGGLAVSAVAAADLGAWRAACRQSAARCAAAGAPGGEILNRMLAGFLSGVHAGYGSHLALDAFTPRSLPLLGR